MGYSRGSRALQCGRVAIEVVLILRDRASGDSEALLQKLRIARFLHQDSQPRSVQFCKCGLHGGRGLRIAQKVFQRNPHGGALHIGHGRIEAIQYLLLERRLAHQIAERRSGIQHLAKIRRPRFFLQAWTATRPERPPAVPIRSPLGSAASRGRTTAWLSGFPCLRISTTLLTSVWIGRGPRSRFRTPRWPPS
jgi:hypothetical protein